MWYDEAENWIGYAWIAAVILAANAVAMPAAQCCNRENSARTGIHRIGRRATFIPVNPS
jgi:hypothetical protein